MCQPAVVVDDLPEHADSASWIGRNDEGSRLRDGYVCLDGEAGVADLTDGGVWDHWAGPSGDRNLVCLVVDSKPAENAAGLGEWGKHDGKKG